ncbi:MAG: 4'-phosphopantetheinyl transferase superfamily protein [Clostridia bacterium]|nr:4'-phosphopantetheinyl transferase superfamily protein [Clostridia bacterium]
MTELFLTENSNLYEKAEALIKRRLDSPFKILRNENGKPYIEGDPLYFSLSHSGTKAAIALSDSPCGVDLEMVNGKSRKVVLNSFSNEERAEIASERDFLTHWTVRESYIKMLGLTLASKLKNLEYVGGELFDNGQKPEYSFFTDGGADFVFSLCVQSRNEKPPVIKNI